ncbi:chemotaxis protein CheA [Sphingobium subterraneum]|uniref:Chemotaxis protein CheA n=1 Tax=Sphingobium subterraneum TaxID=627688 RepID=A0A841IVN7_9SPHN|nr:chemotaxis protein CheW [Sphingobium subterraneum]MBB6122320.1 two-component system chemotaxis sensor kinase CheA [Sphingobium subterraneum]
MDELLAEFIAETQETLEALAGEVVAWEADPSDRERLDAVFRFFHTVKGSCGFLNLPRFEKLSHAAEDVLSHVRAGEAVPDSATISAVLSVMDRIAELCSAVEAGAPLPQENDDLLIQALHHCYAMACAASEVVTEESAKEIEISPVADPRRPSATARTIRLPLTLIDQLMNGVSDMVLARNELARRLRERESDPELEMVFERLSGCIADMRDSISKTRVQRVERLFMAVPRMVRDLSRDLGKIVDLTVEGGDVEMDREMVEMVVDPLTHIVRNSIDHGIETPEQRRAAGKPEAGQLRLSARQSGSQIVIEVSDDGRGINVNAVVNKVVSSGAMTQQDVAQLTEQERLELIFSAGLSTAQEVTSVSGRGVGMDVVRANIERIGGAISLANAPGRGLTITMRVPLTLTIIPGLILNAGGQSFAIPRSAVVEILHENNPMVEIATLGMARVAAIRGLRYSMIDLEEVVGLPVPEQTGPRSIMVVRSSSGLPYALAVSSVENHEELVIRPAAPMVMAAGVYAGMTLPDNGQPMLLLDAGGIANVAELPLETNRRGDQWGQPVADAPTTELHSGLQFVELTGEDRIILLSLVERVEDIEIAHFGQTAGQAHVMIEGRLIPSVRPVQTSDIGNDSGLVTCLRLRDGQRELCYPIRSIVDIFEIPVTLDMSAPYDHVAGLTLIEGRQVEVVDGYSLFADLPDTLETGAAPKKCIIADGQDNWNRNVLAPLLIRAGYEVVLGIEGDAGIGDAVVLSTNADIEPRDATCPIVRLRAASKPATPSDDSIYRYDREALFEAIHAAHSERKTA